MFVPSCGCACATRVPARSTICSSQDTGALSGRTNTNTLLSLSSPHSKPSSHHTSQHASVNKFAESEPIEVRGGVKRKKMAKRDELEGQGEMMIMMHCMMVLIVKVQTERFFMLQLNVCYNAVLMFC